MEPAEEYPRRRMGKALLELSCRICAWEQSLVREEGLTVPQRRLLHILGAEGPHGVKDLAAHMGVTVGTTSVLVDRLQEAGMLTRTRNPRDKRKLLISLTATGRAVFDRHSEQWRGFLDLMCKDLTDEAMEHLSRGLEHMNGKISSVVACAGAAETDDQRR